MLAHITLILNLLYVLYMSNKCLLQQYGPQQKQYPVREIFLNRKFVNKNNMFQKNPSVMSNGMANGPTQMPPCSEAGSADNNGDSNISCQPGSKGDFTIIYRKEQEKITTLKYNIIYFAAQAN